MYYRILFGTILFFLLSSSLSNGQDLAREPYLQATWADSTTIMWKTDSLVMKSEVRFSYEKEKRFLFFWKKKKKISATESARQFRHAGQVLHEVVLRGLKSREKYNYTILLDGKEVTKGKDYYFKTAPKKGPEKFSFYALGDIGAKKHVSFADKSANQINNLAIRPDFGLGLGDIVYPKGESRVYDEHLFQPFEKVFRNIPFYPVLGNHDWLTEPDDNFEQEWRLPNNEHFLILNMAIHIL